MKEPIEMRNLYEHETDAYNLEGFILVHVAHTLIDYLTIF